MGFVKLVTVQEWCKPGFWHGMFVDTYGCKLPKTRPDGSPLQDGDKWQCEKCQTTFTLWTPWTPDGGHENPQWAHYL